MKKLFLMLGSMAVFVGVLSGCGDDTSVGIIGGADGPTSIFLTGTVDKQPANEVVWEDGENYAVALLGYNGDFAEGELDDAIDGYLELYVPELSAADIQRVDATGDENYLVIPRYDGLVTVNALEMADGEPYWVTGDALDSFAAQPFLLTCNVSDIYPNALVTFIGEDVEDTFEPFISLKDGTLSISESGQDITKYSVNE